MNWLENALSPALVRALGWTIVHSLWQGAVVGLALVGLLLVLRRHSAQVRYNVACVALATMLGLALVTFGRHYAIALTSAEWRRSHFHHHTLSPMGQVALEGMEFYAFHGYYDEEQKLGNRYSVDLYVKADLRAAGTSDELPSTVNYVVLYQCVQEEMLIPARLLEHVGHRILDRVLAAFPHIRAAKVSVAKFNPPFGGICRQSRVTLKRKGRLQP